MIVQCDLAIDFKSLSNGKLGCFFTATIFQNHNLILATLILSSSSRPRSSPISISSSKLISSGSSSSTSSSSPGGRGRERNVRPPEVFIVSYSSSSSISISSFLFCSASSLAFCRLQTYSLIHETCKPKTILKSTLFQFFIFLQHSQCRFKIHCNWFFLLFGGWH